jgi:hypothetical protein
MVYNMTRLDNSTTLVDYFDVINDNLGLMFPLFILYGFWLILLIGFKNYDTRVALISSSTITSLMGVLFWWLGWISYVYIFPPVMLVFVGIIWKVLSD